MAALDPAPGLGGWLSVFKRGWWLVAWLKVAPEQAWRLGISMTDFDEQIAALERDISDKFSQYQTRKEERNTNKAKIKEWNTSFTAREGRAPSNEDKAQIRPLYIAHKRHETDLKELKARSARKEDSLRVVGLHL